MGLIDMVTNCVNQLYLLRVESLVSNSGDMFNLKLCNIIRFRVVLIFFYSWHGIKTKENWFKTLRQDFEIFLSSDYGIYFSVVKGSTRISL
jgi:hypothetical protein